VSASRRVVYFHLTGTDEAGDYEELLQANGFEVERLPLDAISSVEDFGEYRAIVLGPDTGNEEVWGDTQGAQVSTLIGTGLPILGLGDGGAAFFRRANLAIGWNNASRGEGTDIVVADPANSGWSTPYQISIPDNRVLTLYSQNSSFVAINVQVPPADVVLIAHTTDNNNQFPIIRQGEDYLLWGFSRGPGDMTTTGQQAFVNILSSLVP
jgi:hypothetical protein